MSFQSKKKSKEVVQNRKTPGLFREISQFVIALILTLSALLITDLGEEGITGHWPFVTACLIAWFAGKSIRLEDNSGGG